MIEILSNDAILLGLLITVLAFVFYTSSIEKGFWKKIYTYCPPLLVCYFIPSLFNTFGWVDPKQSQLYFVASRYLLPASLALFCVTIDFKGLVKLGTKSLIMFFAATVGVVIGAPIALLAARLFISPDAEIWKGMATIAGSWIGGGANQAAMREIYQPNEGIYSAAIVVDTVVANIWMGCLLYGVSIKHKIDRWLKADNSAIDDLYEKLKKAQNKIETTLSVTQIYLILFVGFGATAVAHFGADFIQPIMAEHSEWLSKWKLTSLKSGFFWLVLIATSIGLVFSFTNIKDKVGQYSSKVGSTFLYLLVATIGLEMDITQIAKYPSLFLIGIVWMLVHVIVLLVTAKIIKAPFFFVAVGSQANIGGAASAPIVASAFSELLAPVGVIMAVLGYALGTYAAIICSEIMKIM